jgi:putative glycosyltransferase
MKLSVVATLYNSAPWLEDFHARVRAAISPLTEDFEIVLVNDGSPDDSLRLAIDLSRRDPRVLVVDLSRNFGHHKAIMTGLEMARGELIFLIDSDLEEPPESFADFHAAMQAHRCDVVYGFQDRRNRGLLDRISGAIYYRTVNAVSAVKIPRNLVTARLMTRRFVASLLRHREREIFISGLWAATGYEQVGIPIAKSSGAISSYTFWHRLSIAWMSMISFSDRPLVFAAFAGASISCISFLVIIYLVIRRLFQHLAAGWASVVASIWFLGGLTIFLVGLVGLYVSKIFIEVKQRPYTIVRDIYRGGEPVDLEGSAR